MRANPNAVVENKCPNCGKVFKATIGQLTNDEIITLPCCGAQISTKGFKEQLESIEQNMIKNLRKGLKLK